ncbi:hypothetical protein SLS62_005536 [Diatrype stigma]|uniref:Uncharacterized protein n=1 Tax=Diatrype stigma TaxID=117547 RepID=A0AAN9YNI3_9PEZI
MSTLPKVTPQPLSAPLSVRAAVYNHDLLGNKESQPLVSLRLRSSSSSTFADLAASVIDRYDKLRPGNGHRSEIGAILDEKNCSFDMEDPIDIIHPNELVRFILARPVDVEGIVSSPNTVQQTRPSFEGQSGQPSAKSVTITSTASGKNMGDGTAHFPQKPPQLPPARKGSSDPIEVDSHGTPIPPKKSPGDELRITAATPVEALSRSSQIPSSPIRPARPAVKSTALARQHPPKRAKSVVQHLRESSTMRLPRTGTPITESNQAPSTLLSADTSIATPTAPARHSAHTSTIQTPPQAQRKTAVPVARSSQVTTSSNRGRSDPYEVPSDDEVNDLPIRKLSSKITPRSVIGSAKHIKQEANAAPDRTQTPGSKVLPTTPAGQSITPNAKRTPGSSARTPKPIPDDAEIVSLLDSSNTDESRRKSLKQIAEGAPTISLSDSQSDTQSTSDEINEGPKHTAGGNAASAQISEKALGKRSHHSVNDHVDIINQQDLKPITESPKPILARNARGIVAVYRKGEASSSPAAAGGSPFLKASPRRTRQVTKQIEETQKAQNLQKNPVPEARPFLRGMETKQPRSAKPSHKSPETVIEHVKSKMEVKFGKKAEPPIPDAFFAERKNSDDEYRDYSSDEGAGYLAKGGTREPSIKPRNRRWSTASTHSGKGSRLRSLSQSSSQGGVTPMNTLKSAAQDEKPLQSTQKFHRGYPKRIREKFSDASDSEDSEVEDGVGESHGNKATRRQVEPIVRKSWWNPMDWISKFETTFRCHSTEVDSQAVADGPFQGYIPFGSGAGTYLPGYRPPTDEKLSRAERTAVPKYASSDVVPDDSTTGGSDIDDNVSELSGTDGDGPEAKPVRSENKNQLGEVVLTGNTTGGSIDTCNAVVPGRGHDGFKPRLGMSRVIPSSQTPDPSVTSAEEDIEDVPSPLRDRIAERAERLDRTTQYVLTGTPNPRHPPSNTHAPSNATDSPSQRLPSNLAPATTPAIIESPPTGVSETTSVQIAQQLTQDSQFDQDNAPPSNQELGILLSSSPVRASHQRTATPMKAKAKASRFSVGPDHDDALTVSSTEPSAGIPAHLPPKTPPKGQRSVPRTPPAVVASPSLENPSPSANFILNGIAHRRSIRLMAGSSATRPSYLTTGPQGIVTAPEKVAGGTPSKPARKGSAIPKDEKALSPEDNRAGASSHRATSISVELPSIPADKQAEYAAVTPGAVTPAAMTPERKPTKTLHPLKSFKEINENSSGVSTPQPHDVADEALEYVLRESPKWLNNITQVDPDTSVMPGGVSSSASAARVRKLRGAKNKNNDLAGPGQQLSETVEHPASSVPLPVTPVFPDLTGGKTSQRAPSSKKRKRDSITLKDVPLPLELPAPKSTNKRSGVGNKKNRSEDNTEPRTDVQDQVLMDVVVEAPSTPAITKDLGSERMKKSDNSAVLLSDKKEPLSSRKLNKGKRQEHVQTPEPENGSELDIKVSQDDNHEVDEGGNDVAEDNGPPKKKARFNRIVKNERRRLQQQAMPANSNGNTNANANVGLHPPASTTLLAGAPSSPAQQKGGKNKKRNKHKNRNRNHHNGSSRGSYSGVDGNGGVFAARNKASSPLVRARLRASASPMGLKAAAGKWTTEPRMISKSRSGSRPRSVSRPRTIITPPATSRPSSPESMRA